VKSLRRETAALAGNLHPALPRLFADGTDDPVPHLLIEYVDGPSLADELDENGTLDPSEVALLGAQLLPAVMSLHQRGLAHLDLKPDNIVLRDAHPILIDFGSARRLGSLQPSGHPVGTLGYAPPEQEACEPVSAAMDLYALGQTLQEALTPAQDSEVQVLVNRLLAADPQARGTAAEALVAFARSAGAIRPWPEWLDRFAIHHRSAHGERDSRDG
jgi:serine/threonine protein kinase